MSDKLPMQPHPNNNEEVDLGQLFNTIGRLFERFFNFIASIFKLLFKLFIFALKPIVNHIKLLSVILAAAAIVGFIADKLKTPTYYSEMLVHPHFESKYKLSNNINYFNALIASENVTELSKIFEVDSAEAKSMVDYELSIGPETPNSLLKQYDNYVQSLDSVLAAEVTYDDFLENRNILSGDVFLVRARSKNKNVFPKLEKGFSKTFENPYSKKLKKIRDSTIQIKKEAYKVELRRLDSLQRIYIDLIRTESENNSFTIGTQGTFPLQLERTPTKEYNLFQEELRVRREIRDLDQELIEDSVFYDVIAGFEDEGTLESSILSTYAFLFPAAAFLVLFLTYILTRLFKFIKAYEA